MHTWGVEFLEVPVETDPSSCLYFFCRVRHNVWRQQPEHPEAFIKTSSSARPEAPFVDEVIESLW